MPARPLVLAGLALATPLLLAGCGSMESAAADGTSSTIAVNASDTNCVLDASTVEAGSVSFAVTNSGSQVTEVYVYGADGAEFTTVLAEVEDIGPGTSRDMTADLGAGTYEVACKAGQTGDGVRARLTVTGDAGAASASATVTAREVALVIEAGDQLAGATDSLGATGERIAFEVTNSGAASRVFEVKRPDGSVAGEVDIDAGQGATLTVDLTVPGDWLLIVEGGTTETETIATVS